MHTPRVAVRSVWSLLALSVVVAPALLAQETPDPGEQLHLEELRACLRRAERRVSELEQQLTKERERARQEESSLRGAWTLQEAITKQHVDDLRSELTRRGITPPEAPSLPPGLVDAFSRAKVVAPFHRIELREASVPEVIEALKELTGEPVILRAKGLPEGLRVSIRISEVALPELLDLVTRNVRDAEGRWFDMHWRLEEGTFVLGRGQG